MTDWITATGGWAAWTALALAVLSIAISWATRRRIVEATAQDAADRGHSQGNRGIQIEVTPEPEKPNRPLKLTEYGWKLMNDMDAARWVRSQTSRLKNDVAAMKPYEVDIYAHGVIEKHGLKGPKTKHMLPETTELHDKVSECAYEHGASREDVLNALQVLLREELLKERAGKSTETEDEAA